MLADLRDALRQLRRTPGVTTTAVITLALGIGATTAIFTLVNQILLQSLPVTKPEELWRIGDKVVCCTWDGFTQGIEGDFSLFSWEAYRNFRAQTPEFSDLAALEAGNSSLVVRKMGSREPADIRNGEYVSGNFFRTFGVQPWKGRLMTDADDREGAPPVMVMSYQVWQEKYGADSSVVGAPYQINGHPFTVIGVAAPGFYGAKLADRGIPDFWLPLTTEPLIDGEIARLTKPDGNFLDLIGRVRPGVSPKGLEAKLKAELHNWLASHVRDMVPSAKQLWRKQTLHLVPGDAGVTVMRDQYQNGLKLLLIAAGCLLLLACANLANLLLARGLRERGQLSIRIALGASRGILMRKVLVESTLLAAIGGVLGIGVGYVGTRLILALAFGTATATNYVPVSAAPSWPVLLFTMSVSMLSGIVFAIIPAWTTSHADPAEVLRSTRSIGLGRSWIQKPLIVIQIAVSLVLLSTATLMGRSLRNLEHQDYGFETRDRYIARINSRLAGYKPEHLEPLFRQIQEKLLHIAGVRMVAPALYAPMSGDRWYQDLRIQGRPEPPPGTDYTAASWARVMPGFFETIGAKIVLGRTITDEDTAETRKVAVINQTFANRFFKNQNPIGQHFGIHQTKYSNTYEIVGVSNDVRYLAIESRKPVRPMFWVPETQTVPYDDPIMLANEIQSHYLYNIVLWAPGNPPKIEENVRQALANVDPNLVLYEVVPYITALGRDFRQEHLIATLTMLFGGLGLVLAATGLHGVLAYMVEKRTGEIGLRMALGADRGRVIIMVLRGALCQVGVGVALGIPGAIGVGKLMSAQLYGVTPWDPATLLLAVVLLSFAALMATVFPAWRAVRVVPLVALRAD